VGKVANPSAEAEALDAPALTVTSLDLAAVRRRQFSRAFTNSPLDLNRDGRVNSLDLAACLANLLHALALLTAPAAPGVAILP
jgi:hypothetical protein